MKFIRSMKDEDERHVREGLTEDLTESHQRATFSEKCAKIYNLVADFVANGRRWAA